MGDCHVLAVQMGGDLIAEIVAVDHDPAMRRGADDVERMVEQGFAGHVDERLGAAVGQRAHPRAEPGGKEHHIELHCARSLSIAPLLGGGRRSVTAARSAANSGAARSRIR